MRWLQNVPLRWKLLDSFAIVIILVGAVNVAAFVIIWAGQNRTVNAQQTAQTALNAEQALSAAVNMESGYRGYLLTGRDEFLQPYNQGRQTFQPLVQGLAQAAGDSPTGRRWQDIDQRVATWQRQIVEPGLALRRAVNEGRASLDEVARYVGTGDGKQQFEAIRAALNEAIAAEQAQVNQLRQDQLIATNLLQSLLFYGTMLAVVLAGVLAYFLSRSIANGLSRMNRVASSIASGEIDQRIDVHSRDEIGQLADAFRRMIAYLNQMAVVADAITRGELDQNVEPQSERDVLGVAFERMIANLRRMVAAADAIARGQLLDGVEPQSPNDVLGIAFHRMSENLRELVGELQSGIQSLSAASHEILAAMTQQSSGASEQSAAITQTTATVDEVKASAEQTAGTAMVVLDTAQQASRAAAEGVAAVRAATERMNDIRQRVQSIAENILALSEQSQQIGEIITTVNDLADQSNLLALNAAIEANRAGEHGKGFAVVASEIRSLAEQSKAATAQVKTILSDISRATNVAVMATEQGTKGVDAGVQVIDQAGKTIDDLANVIQHSAQAAQQIAASVRQHSVGMEQIAVAMANINHATNQSLAATSATQNVAETLNELAGRLARLVTQYRLAPAENGRRAAERAAGADLVSARQSSGGGR